MNLSCRALIAATAIALFCQLNAVPQQKAAGPGNMNASKPLTAPLEIVVPVAPWAFQGNGKWHLVYELHVANIGSVNCTLTRIEVVTADLTQRHLANVEGPGLDAIIVHPDGQSAAAATISPAGFAIIYMWVTVDRHEDVPASFFHRITMKVGDYPESVPIDTGAGTVKRDPVPVIDPPLRGGDWGAAHGPANDTHHRRGLLTINGHAYIGERFAIDWLRITPTGDTHTGDARDNRNYPGYGVEVLAVADGVITEERDDIPENKPGSDSDAKMTLDALCGNHVILQFGKSLFASYCHMQTGSIRVKAGAKVKRGQVLGLVGNSGSSGAPHLHFHVCDGNSVFACEGVPYAFRRFVEEKKSFDPSQAAKPDVVHNMEIPTYEMLVHFSD